jgi:hypothetical protein
MPDVVKLTTDSNGSKRSASGLPRTHANVTVNLHKYGFHGYIEEPWIRTSIGQE